MVEAARSDEDLLEGVIAGAFDLDLSDNEGILYENAHRFREDRFPPKNMFEDFCCQGNKIGEGSSKESMEIVCNIIVLTASNLLQLDLSSNKITAAGAGVLARFLGRGGAKMLKTLNLNDNQMENEGVKHLSRVLLSTQQKLKVLWLGKNSISWEGAVFLAEGIASDACRLEDIHLENNLVGNQGMVALSAALAFNSTIRVVDLSDNKIGDIGVAALVNPWETSRETSKGSLQNMKRLDLSENDITSVGAITLFGIDWSKSAPILSNLSLSSNRVSHEGIDRISTALGACRSLNFLCLERQGSRPLRDNDFIRYTVFGGIEHLINTNKHQLFVDASQKSEALSESDARALILARLSSSKTLKSVRNRSFVDAVSKFCNSQNNDSVRQKYRKLLAGNVSKQGGDGLSNKIRQADKRWREERQKRFEAMQNLKIEWSRLQKPLSHLNQQDLEIQSNNALTELAKCSDRMQSMEATHFLSDITYTTALTEALNVKQKCVEDFRKGLFSFLLRPIRYGEAEVENTRQDDNPMLILMKCKALFQLMDLQKEAQPIEIAKNEIANALASVSFLTMQLVGELSAALDTMWECTGEARPQPKTKGLKQAPQGRDLVDRFSKLKEALTEKLGTRWESIGEAKPQRGQEFSNDKLAKQLQSKTEFTLEEWQSFGIKDLRNDSFIQTAAAPLGLKWENCGPTKPVPGQELDHPQLREALKDKTEFTQQEWIGFGITNLRKDHFVKMGDNYFKPAAQTQGSVITVKPSFPS